jgi:hypothetical protein
MEEQEMKTIIAAFAVVITLSLATGNLQAQAPEQPWVVEGLVGMAVPTFDITDLADPGFVAGIAGGYLINEKVLGMVELDWGTHGGVNSGPDVKVYHYMAKAGYRVFVSQEGKWRIFVNAGAGAMTFDADAAGATANTYFAINAGAKIYYHVSDLLSVVISPQGDIAFVDKADGFTGSTAWVWPITAGVALKF